MKSWGEERKVFFFEKKKQKTFANASGNSLNAGRGGPPKRTKVFWFVFSKKHLRPFLTLLITAAAPKVTPTRDVDITYKVPVAGGQDMAILQRFRYSASLRRQRIDLPTSGNWMVLDYASHRIDMVRDESREIVETEAPDNAGQPGGGAGFARLGTAQVAGLPCTEWRTRDTGGHETIACYTDDGVLLRARGDRGVMMEAVDVGFRPQNAEIFALPEGYTRQVPAR